MEEKHLNLPASGLGDPSGSLCNRVTEAVSDEINQTDVEKWEVVCCALVTSKNSDGNGVSPGERFF